MKKDLKVRIISAVVALILIVPLILLGGIYFVVGICLLAVLAYKEIIDLKISHGQIPEIMICIGLLCLVSIVITNINSADIYYGITYQGLCLTTLVIILPTVLFKDNEYSTKDAFYLLSSILFLGLAFNTIIVIRQRGLGLFTYLIALPLLNDTFAYVVGNLCGKHKLCPSISPNKSVEGAIGGLVIGSSLGLVLYYFLVGNISISVVVVTIVLSIIGQMGDLVMSKIKRENKIKDYSNIMPGHGGILDRLDSIIFVFLAYMVLIII